MQRERAAIPLSKKLLNGVLYPEQLMLGLVYGDVHTNRIRMTKERLIDIEFGRTPDLKMLDGWGRKRDLPDKSQGCPEVKVLSRKWEEHGPLAEDGSSLPLPEPEWLAAAQQGGSASHEGCLTARRSDAEEEEARQQWLSFYLSQGNYEKAAELVVTEEERYQLRCLRSPREGAP